MRHRLLSVLALGVSLATATLLPAAGAHAEPYTRVFINGVPTPVFFNDGDSFRIQAGPFKGAQARLSGYNTLESFGPHHSWGTWTAKELYVTAKMATLTARKGEWNCEGDGNKDGYGRLLMFCKDLALHLIQKGLAHAYSVNEQPGDADMLAVQREAMTARVGMWAHGVPRFVMTSLHSKDEGGDKRGITSNRLISTVDGHSEKWVHEDNYGECQKVCHQVPGMSEADLDANLSLLRNDPAAGAALAGLDTPSQRAGVRAVVEGVLRGAREVDDVAGIGVKIPRALGDAGAVVAAVRRLKDAGHLAITGTQEDSCLVYVDFRRRFGGERAVCLR